jgi:transcriptional regulator with PAS, ATPase and Fis domain
LTKEHEEKITCKEGEILNPKTNSCEKIAKEEVKEEVEVREEESDRHEEVACDLKTHKIDPDTGDCVKISEVTKPVVKKKLVRTKKPTPPPVKKPVAKKPEPKKPEEKKVAAKEPCEDDLKLAREESARLKREKEEADRLAAESQKKIEEANRLLEIERQKKVAASEGNFHVFLKGKAKTGGEMISSALESCSNRSSAPSVSWLPAAVWGSLPSTSPRSPGCSWRNG